MDRRLVAWWRLHGSWNHASAYRRYIDAGRDRIGAVLQWIGSSRCIARRRKVHRSRGKVLRACGGAIGRDVSVAVEIEPRVGCVVPEVLAAFGIVLEGKAAANDRFAVSEYLAQETFGLTRIPGKPDLGLRRT